MQITIFKDIKDTSQPIYRNVDIILQRIKEGASKELIKKIIDKTKVHQHIRND